jgi:hypothetical protein
MISFQFKLGFPALARSCFLLLCMAAPIFPSLHAEEHPHLDAIFLFHIVQFVTWPQGTFPTPNATFHICIAGDDRLLVTMRRVVEGKSIEGRPIAVRDLALSDRGSSCQVVFFVPSKLRATPEFLAALQESPVLTVGRGSPFTKLGGMVGVAFDRQRLKLEINRPAAERCHLRMSSKLLRLARLAPEAGEESK